MKIEATPHELVKILELITAQPDELLELRSEPSAQAIERTIENLRAQLHGEYLSPAHAANVKVTREGELRDGFSDAVETFLSEHGLDLGQLDPQTISDELATVLMSVYRAHQHP